MSSTSAANSAASQTVTRLRVPETVRIVHWPLWSGGPRVWMIGLGLTAIGVAAGVIAENTTMGGVCLAALLLATWRHWVPVTFDLGTKGVTQSALCFRWRVPWRCFGCYETQARGVWLFHDVERTPFSTLRGIFIPCTEPREQILSVLEFYLAARRPRSANTTRTYRTS